MKYKYHAKCSQCGVGFRSQLRSDLLKRLKKHIWSKHRAWMIGRIKRGLKKAKTRSADNPALQKALLSGVFPVANIPGIVEQYKGMTPKERAVAKNLVRSLTGTIGAEASAIAEVTLKILDRTV